MDSAGEIHTDDTNILLQTNYNTIPNISSEPTTPRLNIISKKKKTPKSRRNTSNNLSSSSSCKRKLKFNTYRPNSESESCDSDMDIISEPFIREIDHFLNEFKRNPEDTLLPSSIVSPIQIISHDVESNTRNLQALKLPHYNSEILPNKTTSSNRIDNYMEQTNYQISDTLPSLSSMWNKSSTNSYQGLSDKFKEEQLRRQHCEKTILELQEKALEHQQKIAVAVDVDNTKNNIIKKLQETCKLLTSKLDSDEKSHQRKLDSYSMKIQNMAEENDVLQKKVKECNLKLSKMSEEDCEMREKNKSLELEMECLANKHVDQLNKLKDSFKDKEDRLVELKESNKLLVHINKQSSDNIIMLQENLEKAKKIQSNLENELAELKERYSDLTDEKTELIAAKNGLKNKLNEEITRCQLLEIENDKLKLAEKDFDDCKNRMEFEKLEIKEQYQKQVENIVLNKLKEFQQQLSNAEIVMENELRNKERSIASMYASQLQKIEQQHKIEINIIEERHREEIKYYNLQLNKINKKNLQLEDYITSYKQKRGNIAAQLHSVMENQWQQALKIITNSSECDAGSNNIQSNYKSTSNNLENKKDLQNSQNKLDKGENPSDENLEEYIKMLLQRPQGDADVKKIESNRNIEKTNNMEFYNTDYPTNDKNFDFSDRKNDQFKPPWKY